MAVIEAGNLRILEAVITSTAFGGSRVLRLGHAAFTEIGGSTQAAASFGTGTTSIATAGNDRIVINATRKAQEAWEIVASITGGSIPANAKLSGYITYVLD